MVGQEINTGASLCPNYCRQPAGEKQRWRGLVGWWAGHVSASLPCLLFSWSGGFLLSDRLVMVQQKRTGATGEDALPTQRHSPRNAPEAQPDFSQTGGRRIYGEDGEAVWYLTKAMAASSLQNSSSTITPSRSVMWSMLRQQARR